MRITASGMPCASVMRWCFEPGRARSVGFGPVFDCTHRADGGGIDNDTGPVNLVGRASLREQDFVQPVPDAGGRPVSQTAPAAHAAAAAHLAWPQVPAQARVQDEQDAGEHGPVIQRFASRMPRTAGFGWRQQWLNECPQLIIEYRLSHMLFVTETMMRLTAIVGS